MDDSYSNQTELLQWFQLCKVVCYSLYEINEKRSRRFELAVVFGTCDLT